MKYEVLTCFYQNDNPVWFDKALNSLVKQSFKGFRLVLVQDGPVPDVLKQVALKYGDSLDIQYLVLEQNRGLSGALNHGLRRSSADIVFRHDADDLCSSNRLDLQISGFRSNDVVLGGQIVEIDEKDNPVAVKRVPTDPTIIKKFAAERNPVNHNAVAFRRNPIMDLGGYPDIHYKEDYALWIKSIAAGYTIRNLRNTLCYARVSEGFYKRRSGLAHVLSELKLHQVKTTSRIWAPHEVAFSTVKRTIACSLPPFAVQKIYNGVLRHGV